MASKKVKKSADLKIITEEHPEFVSRIATFATQNRDMIGYVLTGIIVLTAVFFFMHMNSQAKENEASIQFQNAIKQYQQDKAASSISLSAQSKNGDENAVVPEMQVKAKSPGAFQSVFDNYPTTRSGQNSLYMVGISHLNQGNYQDAIDILDQFVTDYPDNPLSPSGLLAQATGEFNLENTQGSIATLEKIQSKYPDFYLMDVVYFELAKRYKAMNNNEKAIELYETVVNNYPDSQWKSMSEQEIELINKETSGE